jgi:hypothetical protein
MIRVRRRVEAYSEFRRNVGERAVVECFREKYVQIPRFRLPQRLLEPKVLKLLYQREVSEQIRLVARFRRVVLYIKRQFALFMPPFCLQIPDFPVPYRRHQVCRELISQNVVCAFTIVSFSHCE